MCLIFKEQLDLRDVLSELARRNSVLEHFVNLGRGPAGNLREDKISDDEGDDAGSTEAE